MRHQTQWKANNLFTFIAHGGQGEDGMIEIHPGMNRADAMTIFERHGLEWHSGSLEIATVLGGLEAEIAATNAAAHESTNSYAAELWAWRAWAVKVSEAWDSEDDTAMEILLANMPHQAITSPAKLGDGELHLIAEMLEYAAEAFSYNGCNDMSIPGTPENKEIVRQSHIWNTPDGDPEDDWEVRPYQGGWFVADFAFMRYLAHRARQANATE
jgi:hypothetical protein